MKKGLSYLIVIAVLAGLGYFLLAEKPAPAPVEKKTEVVAEKKEEPVVEEKKEEPVKEEKPAPKGKVAIVTNTVSQNEEEYRSA